MHSVELTPATAPAIDEAGIGIVGCSPGLGDNCFLTVSYANNCMSITCDCSVNIFNSCQKLHDMTICVTLEIVTIKVKHF